MKNIFTKDLQVGDLVITYRKGFHIITKVKRRFITKEEQIYICYKDKLIGDEINALIYYKQVADSKGNPKKSKREYCCDVSFCKKVDKSFIQIETEKFQERIERINTLIGKTNNTCEKKKKKTLNNDSNTI